jgi:polysaccharide pyruvyl transferase WcaK-like protein
MAMKNEEYRIYLYGIRGIYNYGCEAMIRSISDCLKKRIPNCRVTYKTYDYDNDKKALVDCHTVDIEAVRHVKRPITMRALRYIKRKLRVASPEDFLSIDLEWTQECDLLIIIGGDVFDLAWHQRNAKIYDNDRIFVSEIVKKTGGKVALWGISVGDFDCNPSAKAKLTEYFNKIVDVAIIRDKKSISYLKENGVSKCTLYSDPAFIQRTVQTEQKKKNILGINLSPLSNKYLQANRSREEWVALWSDYVYGLFDHLNYSELFLIPHVVNPNMLNDDDYSYLKDIYCNLRDRNLPVKLLPENLGFLSIKPFLCECDLILAARMHCAVNAVTCGIPTVFLSYSPKSVGMCQHVYGNEKMVIDMNEMIKEPHNYDYIFKISQETDKIREYLANRNAELFDDAKSATDELMRAINN